MTANPEDPDDEDIPDLTLNEVIDACLPLVIICLSACAMPGVIHFVRWIILKTGAN